MDLNRPRREFTNQKIVEGADVSSSKEPDIISNLPDAILCYILSFLPTKFAARTGVLSKRWKDLWVSLPTLDFDINLENNYKGDMNKFNSFAKNHIESFTNFVDHLFIIRDHFSIREFRFSCDERFDLKRLYAWMWIVIMCNIEVLDLKIRSLVGVGELPWSLFSSKSLVVLKLSGRFMLDIPFNVSFPRLKILCLKSVVYVSDVSIERLLSSCPTLEDLQISRESWDNGVNIVISQPSLKRLTYEFYGDTSVHSVDGAGCSKLFVKAPNVEYLKVIDHASDLILVDHMPCVNEADICINNLEREDYWSDRQRRSYGSIISGVLRNLSKVKHLSLSGETLKVSFEFSAMIESSFAIILAAFALEKL